MGASVSAVDLLVVAFPIIGLAVAVMACAIALGHISQGVERFVDACDRNEKEARGE